VKFVGIGRSVCERISSTLRIVQSELRITRWGPKVLWVGVGRGATRRCLGIWNPLSSYRAWPLERASSGIKSRNQTADVCTESFRKSTEAIRRKTDFVDWDNNPLFKALVTLGCSDLESMAFSWIQYYYFLFGDKSIYCEGKAALGIQKLFRLFISNFTIIGRLFPNHWVEFFLRIEEKVINRLT